MKTYSQFTAEPQKMPDNLPDNSDNLPDNSDNLPDNSDNSDNSDNIHIQGGNGFLGTKH